MRLHPQTIPELDAALKATKAATKLLEQSLREARAADVASRRHIGNRERIAGWSGPAGWRLQTYVHREEPCSCCQKTIQKGEQHVGWRVPRFPAPDIGEFDGDRKFAHIGCLHKLGQSYLQNGSAADVGLRAIPGLRFSQHAIPEGLRNHPSWRLP